MEMEHKSSSVECEMCKSCCDKNITILSKDICHECERTMIHLTVDHPCYTQYLWQIKQIWKITLVS